MTSPASSRIHFRQTSIASIHVLLFVLLLVPTLAACSMQETTDAPPQSPVPGPTSTQDARSAMRAGTSISDGGSIDHIEPTPHGEHPATAGPSTPTLANATYTPEIVPTSANHGDVVVTVDPAVTFQTMMGFGSSERVWDDPHVVEAFDPATGRGLRITTEEVDELLDRLYLDLGLTRVRAVLEPGIEVENDNVNPSTTDRSGFNFAWKRVDAHVEYTLRAKARGLTTPWFSPLMLEPWMQRNQPAEVAEWLLTVLKRWRELGIDVPYVAVVNEPGYERSGFWTGEQIRDVINELGPRMRAERFTTQFVITDDLNPTEAYRRISVILADPDARQYVGALAYHLYGGSIEDRQRIAELGARYNLPIWMSEYAEPANALAWARIIHDLVATNNVSAVDAMWGYFGDWESDSTHLISIRSEGTRYLGYELTKMYYVTGQFSRFVKPGAQRIAIDAGDTRIKMTAYRDGDRLVVVAVNDTERDRTITLRVAGDRTIGDVALVRTSDTENWSVLPSPAVNYSMVQVTFPAGSVTTLTGQMTTP